MLMPADVTCSVESQQALPHQVVHAGCFLHVERNGYLSVVPTHAPTYPAYCLTQLQRFAAHTLPDDDAFLGIPLLSYSRELQHDLDVRRHALKPVMAAKKLKYYLGLYRELIVSRLQVVEGDRGNAGSRYLLKLAEKLIPGKTR